MHRPQILEDQLTLIQTGQRQIRPLLPTCLPPDFHTFRRPCMDTMIVLIVITRSFVPFFSPLLIQLTGKMTTFVDNNRSPQVTFQLQQKGLK